MNYCIYRLKFSSPLHCGTGEDAKSLSDTAISVCADTLFAALCTTAASDGGAEAVKSLYEAAKGRRLIFSDLMPYRNGTLYIPKPAMLPSDTAKLSDPTMKKAYKKLTHIPLGKLDKYIASLKGGADFAPDPQSCAFAVISAADRVSLKGCEESEPYYVVSASFSKDCGLYGIISYENDEERDAAVRLLKLTGAGGIGGKVSSGYGKFCVEDKLDLCCEEDTFDEETRMIWKNFEAEKSSYISLTASLPKDTELDGAMDGANTIIKRRGGFTASQDFGSACKKTTQYFFAAGSVFRRRHEGDIYDAAPGGAHPVYRYSIPLLLGVDYEWEK